MGQYSARSFGKRNTIMRGWIKADGRPKLECAISHITDFGAFLGLSPPDWLPFTFDLRIERTGEIHACQIRHVVEHGVGVNFILSAEAERVQVDVVGTLETAESWSGVGNAAGRGTKRRTSG